MMHAKAKILHPRWLSGPCEGNNERNRCVFTTKQCITKHPIIKHCFSLPRFPLFSNYYKDVNRTSSAILLFSLATEIEIMILAKHGLQPKRAKKP